MPDRTELLRFQSDILAGIDAAKVLLRQSLVRCEKLLQAPNE